MGCLTDVDVQTFVDDEAPVARRAHAASCLRCREHIEERRRAMAAVVTLMEEEGRPSHTLEARVRRAMTSDRAVRGSTVLRSAAGSSRWRRLGWRSALATAGAVAVVVFVILPRLGAPTSLSASEILGRSLQTLSGGSGVELLEYEVTMNGMAGGPVVIRQLIDRENPARYKIASYGPDGLMRTAISQDPLAQRRAQLIQVDGTNYIVRVGPIHNPVVSLPQMAQALMETTIGIMQAKSDQQLTVVDGPAGRQYLIEVPPVMPQRPASTLDIFGARAVINGEDFHILEFEATGALLKLPFSVSVKLRSQVQADGTSPGFEIQPGPGDVVLEGEAGDDPVVELLTTVLRELGRLRGN